MNKGIILQIVINDTGSNVGKGLGFKIKYSIFKKKLNPEPHIKNNLNKKAASNNEAALPFY